MYVCKTKSNIHSSIFIPFSLVTNDIKSACHLPMVRGNCDQQISRWYFNPADQYCHSFQYTGC
ncbi:unnamed protein product, partial [Rotaria socialis]